VTGFSTDYVNQIAINLRDRYKSGFPILKELVQNADDAGARNLVFGFHPGHGESADHMLLSGPALWVLNDGAFKPSDKRAIRSFGLNAKAGDSGAIGKFGLGMKSVFHLCETFLYVACAGGELLHDVLNPWKADDVDCAEMHLRWETVTDRDVECLASVARSQPEVQSSEDWFLLWVPLRRRAHVPHGGDRPAAAIIERYPGESADGDLDFFSDPRTDQRIGAVLPLLKNLQNVRFAGASMRPSFSVHLDVQPPGERLDHISDCRRMHGVVRDDRPRAEHLQFLARQRVEGDVPPFSVLRSAASWPTSMVITPRGPREPRPDKAIAEAALMFAHANSRVGRVSLQWAVFLPADEQSYSYEATIPGTSREYRIVLHGQFFVDAGRRGIADMDMLAKPVEPSEDAHLPQPDVIRRWNQSLAQQTVLPEFLPTLADYVKTVGLKDEEIADLTRGIELCTTADDAAGQRRFFGVFRDYICDRWSWVRRLTRDGPGWDLLTNGSQQLLALPSPPSRDPQRPWRALPGLALLQDCVFFDATASALTREIATWGTGQIVSAISGLSREIVKSETDLDYLATFLEQESHRFVRTSEVQDALVSQLRQLLLNAPLADFRQHRKIFKRVFSTLSHERLFALGPVDPTARGAIPEALLRRMLTANASALPIPSDLAPDGLVTSARDGDLRAWLDALANGSDRGADTSAPQLLEVAERIIKAAGDDDAQASLVRSCSTLRILRAFKGRDGEIQAVSLSDLMSAQALGLVFRVADASRPLGFVSKLAAALPALTPLVVRAGVASFVDACKETSVGKVPGTESVEAILKCAGAAPVAPDLGTEAARADLLSLVATASLNDRVVVRGVRYLLHGSPQHYLGDEVLWKDPVGQQSPWVRLWRMIDQSPWRVLADRLCGSIPDKCAQALNLRAVDEASVLSRLRVCTDFSRVDSSAFTAEELDLLLGRIAEEHPWRQLPLHRDSQGTYGSVVGNCYLGAEPALPAGFGSQIRFIEQSANEDHRDRQKQWIPLWTARTAAQTVLAGPNPVVHWRYLMTLLQSHPGMSGVDLPAWKETRWLPLAQGGQIALNSLIRLEQLDAEVRDLARKCEFAYASPSDLSEEVQSHPAFGDLTFQISSGEGALPILGQLMAAAELSIGTKARYSYKTLQEHISTLAALECLPAWTILERAAVATSPEAVEQQLVPEVSAPLSEELCRSVLARVASRGQGSGERTVFEHYLREWRESGTEAELRRHLGRLGLLSKAGTWVSAEALVEGVEGVVPECALIESHAAILRGVLTSNLDMPDAETESDEDDGADEAHDRLSSDLEEYVEPLASTGAKQAVGAVLGLFGQRAASLAKNWLEPIAFEDYLDKLGWKDPGFDHVAQRWEWMSRKSAREALASLAIRVNVLGGSQISALTLTGRKIKVRLVPADQVQSLHVMTDKWRGMSCRVHLHPAATLLDRDLTEQRDVLMRTAESLLRGLYNQRHANLSEFFALAEEADQVTLDVARGLILDGLPQSLRSLPGITKNRKLADALARLDGARRAAASAKRARRTGADVQEERQRALDDLARLVEEDEEVQESLLAGIRARVAHNQYEYSSIPFEVFQNADDAVVEMQALQHADDRPHFDAESIGRFVLQSSDRTLRFMHWGRPINYAGRHTNARPEYGNDLERMLMLGASAKDPDEGVTGKFGLGFKSLLLASRAPRVSSGDLAFDVVAGCLPRKWKLSPSARQFQQSVTGPAQKGLRGTLIELPLDERGAASQVVDRFTALAGLLPVFARQVVQVEVGNETHQWRPARLALERDYVVEVGSVALPVQGGKIHSRLLVIRSASGCVVMRIGKSGVEEFDRRATPAVPAVWVTAPTRGTAARGILINASFQIDTGRATLGQGHAATAGNARLIEIIAGEVAPVFVALLNRSLTSWDEFSARLDFSSFLSASGFWQSLWAAVLSEAPGDEVAADVRLLDRLGYTLFRQVVEQTAIVPNGFAEDQSGFVRVSEIALSVNTHYLSSVVPALSAWPAFVEKYPIERWCTDTVRGWVGRASIESELRIPTLGIGEVVSCLSGGRLSPEEIPRLASVLRLWPSNLGEGEQWRKALAEVQLRARNGSWSPARAFVGGSVLGDEYLHHFAPDSTILDPSYSSYGDDFSVIEQLLPNRHPDANLLGSWCLAAGGEEQREAVVHWLTRNLYSPVIDYLRIRRLQGGWLFDLTLDSPPLTALSLEERQILLIRLGVSSTDVPGLSVDLSPSLDLQAISGWWQENGHKWARRFDDRLWPSRVDKQALKSEPFDRAAWMTLFSLGVFRRYGRVNDEQHRGFLEFLDDRGWWQTICEVDPDVGADAWMGILRAYAEDRQTDTVFELWMDSFPRLYRVARWLETYVHLFQTLDQRESVLAKFLLSPAADPSLSGSGIDAPTLTGILRLGQHLVVRELLRAQVLSSSVAREMAFAPRASVLDLMDQLGFSGLQSSSDIFRVLVQELGDEEEACFGGDYDIPLQLLATDSAAREDAERWAEGLPSGSDGDGD
jgi:hypothetical protein